MGRGIQMLIFPNIILRLHFLNTERSTPWFEIMCRLLQNTRWMQEKNDYEYKWAISINTV